MGTVRQVCVYECCAQRDGVRVWRLAEFNGEPSLRPLRGGGRYQGEHLASEHDVGTRLTVSTTTEVVLGRRP